MIARSYVIVNSKFDFSLIKYQKTGAARGIVGCGVAALDRHQPVCAGHKPACGRLLAIIRFSPPRSIPALINHFPLSYTIFLSGANPKYQYSGPGSTAGRSPVPPAPAAAARYRAARRFSAVQQAAAAYQAAFGIVGVLRHPQVQSAALWRFGRGDQIHQHRHYPHQPDDCQISCQQP